MATTLKNENLISHIQTGDEEKETIYIDPNAPPQEKVEEAAKCLGSFEDEQEPRIPQPSFHRWTVLDYAMAYKSGETTPTKVAERFIACAKESSDMSFFINYCIDDILSQAAESTLRHQRGDEFMRSMKTFLALLISIYDLQERRYPC